MASPRLTLFTRYPHAGKAKTRLIPALGEAGAADLHRRLTERTVATMRASRLPLEIRFTGAGRKDFAAWLGDDLSYAEQGDGSLGERLQRATGRTPVVLLGADCPDLQVKHFHQAETALQSSDVVVGPAEDGGYYLLGLRHPVDSLFNDMPWGTDAVLSQTLARLKALAFAPFLLEALADCDRPDDLARWPDLTS